ncbi:MAG: 3-dehydroquinate dehydratase [Candidatus Shikimatogenerans sp. JK-2022]|nr:3-dehydroquinate dehydratase [Candidatus Shikimatogenerans bostrichidophilus]
MEKKRYKKKIIIINGPNINLIGIREVKIYGKKKIKEYLNNLKKLYFKKKIKIKIYFLNSESKIIKLLQIIKNKNINKNILGIIINAGAYSHTSLVISDTLKYIKKYINIIEVHVSNIFKREQIRHKSYISSNCIGIIIGLGLSVYNLGILSLINFKKKIF